jgi:electron transfer flavoprotein beta subunit
MPVVVTVSNEVGEPRYPNLRGIMAATKKKPELFSLNDLNFQDSLADGVCLKRMFIRENHNETEIIKGSDDADAGRKLAIRLKEEGLL